jgi:hypothetical protein
MSIAPVYYLVNLLTRQLVNFALYPWFAITRLFALSVCCTLPVRFSTPQPCNSPFKAFSKALNNTVSINQR